MTTFASKAWRKALCVVIVTMCVVTMTSGPARSEPATDQADVEGLFDVGGYRLFLRCTGSGSPTVVLDAGLANTSATWAQVEPAVAEFTRVCVYDRAFLGQSDDGPVPRTSRTIVDELKALLGAAGERGPYVLVGWSFGAFNMQLYAREDGARAVVGMVMVDGTPAQWVEVADRFGLPVPTPQQIPEPVDLRASAAEVLAAPPFPDIPLTVLTRGVPVFANPELERIWLELQVAHTQLSPRGELVVAEGAGHRIHTQRPDLVIDAIRHVVEAAREDLRPGRGCGDRNHFHMDKIDCKNRHAA